MGRQDPVPRLLLTFSRGSHHLLWLSNNHLNVPTGIQEWSWKLNEGYFLLSREWGTHKCFLHRRPIGPGWAAVRMVQQLFQGLSEPMATI